jgi:hypothetical protein
MHFTALGVILGRAAIPWFTLIGAGVSGFMTLIEAEGRHARAPRCLWISCSPCTA